MELDRRSSSDIIGMAMYSAETKYRVQLRIRDQVHEDSLCIQKNRPYLVTWYERDDKGIEKKKVAKFGRWITTRANAGLSDAEIERLVNCYQAEMQLMDGFKIDLLVGEDIRWAYHIDNNSKKHNTGEMLMSCMNGEEHQDYLDIYVENPEQVALAVWKDEDGLPISRALIWTADNGKKYMDRVYGTQPVKQMYYRWAEENDIANIYDYRDPSVTVSLMHWDFYYYPYMDTFQSLDMSSGTLYAQEMATEVQLISTVGGYVTGEPCEDCGGFVDTEMEGTYIDNHGTVCGDCLHSHYTCCHHCDQFTNNLDATLVGEFRRQDVCPDCLDDMYTDCTDCGRFFLNDDICDDRICVDCFKTDSSEETTPAYTWLWWNHFNPNDHTSFWIRHQFDHENSRWVPCPDEQEVVRMAERGFTWNPAYAQ